MPREQTEGLCSLAYVKKPIAWVSSLWLNSSVAVMSLGIWHLWTSASNRTDFKLDIFQVRDLSLLSHCSWIDLWSREVELERGRGDHYTLKKKRKKKHRMICRTVPNFFAGEEKPHTRLTLSQQVRQIPGSRRSMKDLFEIKKRQPLTHTKHEKL